MAPDEQHALPIMEDGLKTLRAAADGRELNGFAVETMITPMWNAAQGAAREWRIGGQADAPSQFRKDFVDVMSRLRVRLGWYYWQNGHTITATAAVIEATYRAESKSVPSPKVR